MPVDARRFVVVPGDRTREPCFLPDLSALVNICGKFHCESLIWSLVTFVVLTSLGYANSYLKNPVRTFVLIPYKVFGYFCCSWISWLRKILSEDSSANLCFCCCWISWLRKLLSEGMLLYLTEAFVKLRRSFLF